MSWLAPFWGSSIQGLSRDARLVYLYLIGKADELGLVDYYTDQFLLDTRFEPSEFDQALQELIISKLVHSTGTHLIVTNYVWNRRKDLEVMEAAAGIYDDLPAYRKTELQMIPLRGLEFVLNPKKSLMLAEERRLGFDPTQFMNEPLALNPNWTKH